MKERPATCAGCPLNAPGMGEGWVPPEGPEDAKILFLGEAPGETEARTGRPFDGLSGAMLDSFLKRVGLDRKEVRVANAAFQCRPPDNRLNGWYTAQAAAHCSQYIDPILQGPHKMVIPLGGAAIRKLLGLPIAVKGKTSIRVQDFHGQPMQDTQGRWIMATYHPAAAMRKSGLIGGILWDLLRAKQVLQEGFEYDLPSLVINPPAEWWEAWVEGVLATIGTPDEPALAVDTETEGKDPDEGRQDLGELLTLQHRSAHITQVNLSVSKAEGVTVLFNADYMRGLQRLLASSLVKVCHNEPYDSRRLEINGCPMAEPVYDSMDMFHALQSDVPKGLGYIAPYASKAPVWKHLSQVEPGFYGAMDGVQETRVFHWVAEQLLKWGMWEVYERHMWLFRVRCLRPAEKVGLLIDKPGMVRFDKELEEEVTLQAAELQACYPKEIRKLEPKLGLVSKPDWYDVVEKQVSTAVKVCRTCQAIGVAAKHRCKDAKGKPSKTLVAQVETEVRGVTRYFRRHPFNPESPVQVLAYMAHRGHQAGESKKKHKPSSDKKALAFLIRTVDDPFYQLLINHRQTKKIQSTYVRVAIKRCDANSRLHATYLERPSTLRVSCVAPNLTNMAAGKTLNDEAVGKKHAERFRSLILAAPGCELLEADYSGIEAVLVGYFARDPHYIRMAWLGVHAWLLAIVLGKTINPKWDDVELGDFFKKLKNEKQHEILYNACKRVIHGSSYGLTPYGMVENYPEIFHTQGQAKTLQDTFFRAAPKVHQWQREMQAAAQQHHQLGGPHTNACDPTRCRLHHPFAYKHWFWAVTEQRRGSHGDWYTVPGPDAKRTIAYFPQSSGRGILTEAMLRLHDPEEANYIGDVFYGQVPLRAVIHDSGLFEYPVELRERMVRSVYGEMVKPIPQFPCPEEWGIGPFLKVGVEMKAGPNWRDMKVVPPIEVGVASDSKVIDLEEDEEEEIA